MTGVPYSTSVREMPEEERPRERLTRLGPEALRDAELIAILFRTGTRSTGAVALGEEVIRHFGNLRNLARASLQELREVTGLGDVKAIEIKAALELGKRLATYSERDKTKITAPEDVANLLMARFKDYETEHFKCILLNTKKELLRVVDVSKGGLDSAPVAPRDVFRIAVREGASAAIMCHNHPSGDPEPSKDDIQITRRLCEAGEIIGISVEDHVIFGDGRFVSLRDRGLI